MKSPSDQAILCRVNQNEAEDAEGGLAPSLTRPSVKGGEREEERQEEKEGKNQHVEPFIYPRDDTRRSHKRTCQKAVEALIATRVEKTHQGGGGRCNSFASLKECRSCGKLKGGEGKQTGGWATNQRMSEKGARTSWGFINHTGPTRMSHRGGELGGPESLVALF